jgi:peptidoglycan/LPS O-acetylase OafA/YrhL
MYRDKKIISEKFAESTKVYNKRIPSIDAYRALLSFLIVCIHSEFPSVGGDVVVTIARIAVPSFFVISGYFMFTNSVPEFIIRNTNAIKRMLLILFLTSVSFLIMNVIQSYIDEFRGGIYGYFSKILTVKMLVKFILFNVNPLSEPLWYLLAYVYALVIYLCFVIWITKHNKIVVFASFVLLICCAFLSSYFRPIFGDYYFWGIESDLKHNYIYRNAIFEGFPLFSLGFAMAKNRERLFSCFQKVKRINLIFFVLTIIFTLLSMYERFVLCGINSEIYLSTTPLALCIFLFLLRNNDLFSSTILPKIGKEYSLYIYIIHPVINNLYDRISLMLSFNDSFFEASCMIVGKKHIVLP